MIAVSLTYFTLASRRVVDSVPMHIMHYLVRASMRACFPCVRA